MTGWTVGQLKEELDNYGDHLPVVILVERPTRTDEHVDYELSTGSPQGEPRVELTIDQL